MDSEPTEDASSRLSRDRRLNWKRSHLGTRAILKPCSVQHSLLGGRLLVSLTGVFPFTVWLPWRPHQGNQTVNGKTPVKDTSSRPPSSECCTEHGFKIARVPKCERFQFRRRSRERRLEASSVGS
ncbi:hypothetical protein NDU88_007325 [Pleurodeles waltl]|uniref:Uncharacterized protein n=1 Tax=Pleurodeles waltl TaxID=8319 RepID=A0AAV7QRA5_PLEWA|nr:hypothetical protein NDU88_007325 [Pleurodeles waltl]